LMEPLFIFRNKSSQLDDPDTGFDLVDQNRLPGVFFTYKDFSDGNF